MLIIILNNFHTFCFSGLSVTAKDLEDDVDGFVNTLKNNVSTLSVKFKNQIRNLTELKQYNKYEVTECN